MASTALPQTFSTRPLYLQVRDVLLSRITARDWTPGQMVPNELDLAASLGVSVGTVRKAMDTLEQDQIVTRRQGKGTFVTDQSTAALAGRFSNFRDDKGRALKVDAHVKSIATDLATAEEQDKLKLKPGSAVHRIKRVFRSGDQTFMVEKTVLPANLIEQMPVDFGSYQICTLAQQNGILLKEASESISACIANEEDALLLQTKVGTPLLCLDRVLVSIKNVPVEWRCGRCALRDQKYVTTIS